MSLDDDDDDGTAGPEPFSSPLDDVRKSLEDVGKSLEDVARPLSVIGKPSEAIFRSGSDRRGIDPTGTGTGYDDPARTRDDGTPLA